MRRDGLLVYRVKNARRGRAKQRVRSPLECLARPAAMELPAARASSSQNKLTLRMSGRFFTLDLVLQQVRPSRAILGTKLEVGRERFDVHRASSAVAEPSLAAQRVDR